MANQPAKRGMPAEPGNTHGNTHGAGKHSTAAGNGSQVPASRAAKTSAGNGNGKSNGNGNGKSNGKSNGNGKTPRTRKQKVLGFFKWLLIVGLAFTLLLSMIGVILYRRLELPEPNSDFTTSNTYLYYRDGETELGNLSVHNRQPITYEEMPQYIKDAVIAAEDRTFWTNQGISFVGLGRNAIRLVTGGEVAGGSTITQQYIKLMYLTTERTLQRKLKEMVLATKMSREVPKEEILQNYLNTIYFGRGAYGIQAASRAFFDIDASAMNLQQSASLAAILNIPAQLDPADEENWDAFLARYNYVIDGMLTMGTITQQQHDEAYNNPPEFPDVPVSDLYAGANGFLIKMVEEELRERGFSDEEIYGGGLRVTTTFEKANQDKLVEVVEKYVAQANDRSRVDMGDDQLNIGAASVEVGTGEVLAVYGGPDFINNSRNWATTPRPAASSFKPYALVAALRGGQSLQTMVNGNSFTPPGDSVPLNNAGFQNFGQIPVQRAIEVSSNTAFVDLVLKTPNGASETIKAANDAGVPEGPGWEANARIPLGAAEVSPIDQANGYATFANAGARNTAHVVKEVTNSEGDVVYRGNANSVPAIEPYVTADVNYALQGVIQRGTATSISSINRPAAAKTGTNMIESGEVTSSWLVGYTMQISTAVMMVGGDSGTLDLQQWNYDTASVPNSIWLEYMLTATADQPRVDFPPASNVNHTPTPTPTPSDTPTPEPSQTVTPSEEPPTTEPTETVPPTTAPPTTAPPATLPPTGEGTTGN